MDKLVIGICILLVILALFILVRTIIKMSKGKCCENCKHCNVKDNCDASNCDASNYVAGEKDGNSAPHQDKE